MTDYSNYTNKYIENKISLNLKTLNSFSIGEHKQYSDIYSLTSHEYRYSALSTVLKIMAIPLVAVSNVVKILSCEVVAVKEMVNIPLILLKKMDQNIAKKILQGLDDTNEAELRDITKNILEQWKEDNTLIPQEEESVFTRFKNYVCENIPFIESIRNFWVNGGIHYSGAQLEEQHLVKKITKEIFKTAYIAGKEARALSSDDIYNHFKEIGAYKDNMPTKEIDVFQTQWFNNNYDTWDVSYLSDDDTTNLLGDDNDIN
ncbi:hypothetical protein [Rickettsia asembonensis]|uniref:hypothetical protein n=1 Tax=Rickettsia asembonensis TaxID=1068590 RepID=UPI0023F9C520|nr:hypothetical protein [Rickettsia asembonensis]WCR55948.1 MAG: hypothetical protein PG979_000005 [Rickettsia asembonensis]